jgi:hypothetical protein
MYNKIRCLKIEVALDIDSSLRTPPQILGVFAEEDCGGTKSIKSRCYAQSDYFCMAK